jgi:hypothetical protein
MELDPLYVDVIIRRFEEAGITAVLESTGGSFAQIPERRMREADVKTDWAVWI